MVISRLSLLVGIDPVSAAIQDRKSTRLNSSHGYISYAVFCLKKKKIKTADLMDRAQLTDCLSGFGALVSTATPYAQLNKRWDDNVHGNKTSPDTVYAASPGRR